MVSFGPLGFLNPWLLVGLLSLPILWYLLKLIPPKPQKIWFPPLRLLLKLQAKEKLPDQSPWWLLLLRMLLIACIITAFSEPVWNPAQSDSKQNQNTIIIVDNGWASANSWAKRKQVVDNLITHVEQSENKLFLTGTIVNPNLAKEQLFKFNRPNLIRENVANLKPYPSNPNRRGFIKNLKEKLPKNTSHNIIWISDGIDYGFAKQFSDDLKSLSGISGNFEIIRDDIKTAKGLVAYVNPNGDLTARIIRPYGPEHKGTVLAWNAKNENLGTFDFLMEKGQKTKDIKLSLPHTLRNEIRKLTLSNEVSAGAVSLLDSRNTRFKVGIMSGENQDTSQPLLSPSYYIEKALKPYTKIIAPEEKNITTALNRILSSEPEIIILADIAKLISKDEQRLSKWIEEGGVLVRFAGPNMQNQNDNLLPVKLRRGGRALGGTLSWSHPQTIDEFEKKSPFYGLKVSSEIKVKRQVLADPSFLAIQGNVWSRLKDGTPLVTAKKIGKGWVSLFHITANSEWSNLPISGLFVEMLQRITELASFQNTSNITVQTSLESADIKKEINQLPPFKVLDGFGNLTSPMPNVQSITYDKLKKFRPTFENPPGYYGPAESTTAFNILNIKSRLKEDKHVPTGAKLSSFQGPKTILLSIWILFAAFCLLLFDTIIRMYTRRYNYKVASLICLVCLIGFAIALPQKSFAQEREKINIEAAIKASKGTHLGYIITGNDEVDRVSKYGLSGLSKVVAARTAVEPEEPIAVNILTDELAFFPILYWPVLPTAKALPDKALAKIDAYLKLGGMILFDTRDSQYAAQNLLNNTTPGMVALQRIVGKLNIPRIEPVTEGHVLTKSFYLLESFPGRWDQGKLWAESRTKPTVNNQRKARRADGVSSILVTSNDFAAAWALDERNTPLFPIVPGGKFQREMAFRVGINIVMYALTGNYKADQVHVPALLERLGQ